MITIMGRDGAIGVAGDQPWHIAEDFRRFKQLTLGHPIVMGRRTFEALPNGALPGRRNMVISRNAALELNGAEVFGSLSEAVSACEADGIGIMFVIGGGQIYAQAMPHATQLYITQVDALTPNADTFFPPINTEEWILQAQSDQHTDPRSGCNYRFLTYSRT